MSDEALRKLEREAGSGDQPALLRLLHYRRRLGQRGGRVRAPGRGVTARLSHLWWFPFDKRGLTWPCCHRVRKRSAWGLWNEFETASVRNARRATCRHCKRFDVGENDEDLLHEVELGIFVLESTLDV